MSEFAIAGIEVGKLNALVKNLMRQLGTTDPNEAVKRVNSGQWVVVPAPCLWREKDGVIYFSVTSDGTTGEQWIERLERKGIHLLDYGRHALRSVAFKPTSGVTTEVAVLKGIIFEDRDRITRNIRVEAERRKLKRPKAEVACLIRELFTDKEIKDMGFWSVVVMHEPINYYCSGISSLLATFRRGYGDHQEFGACDGGLDSRWPRDSGFAFAVSQV